MKVIVTQHGVIRELIPVRSWHWEFNWRDLRVGVSFQPSMWEFNLPGFCVWCDRYHKHGRVLPGIPRGADVSLVKADLSIWSGRLGDLARANISSRSVPPGT